MARQKCDEVEIIRLFNGYYARLKVDNPEENPRYIEVYYEGPLFPTRPETVRDVKGRAR